MSGSSRAARRHTLPAALALALTPGLVAVVPATGATTASAAPTTASGTLSSVAQEPRTQAVRRKLFRVTSDTPEDGGSRVTGTLKFRSAGQVSVVGRVNDLCPGDGDWGSVNVIAVMETGQWHVIRRHDTGGCESAPLKFRHTFTKGNRIVRIGVQACVHPTGRGFSHKCRKENYANPHA